MLPSIILFFALLTSIFLIIGNITAFQGKSPNNTWQSRFILMVVACFFWAVFYFVTN